MDDKGRDDNLSREDFEAIERFLIDLEKIRLFLFKPEPPKETENQDVALVLRKLTVDKHPLLPRISRILGVKLMFMRFVPWQPEVTLLEASLPDVYVRALAAVNRNGAFLEISDHDRFINLSVGAWNGVDVTPKKIVKLYANKLGGAHFDPPKSGEEYATLYNDRKGFKFNVPGIIDISVDYMLPHMLKQVAQAVHLTGYAFGNELVRRNLHNR